MARAPPLLAVVSWNRQSRTARHLLKLKLDREVSWEYNTHGVHAAGDWEGSAKALRMIPRRAIEGSQVDTALAKS
jgi:hypothetical protein